MGDNSTLKWVAIAGLVIVLAWVLSGFWLYNRGAHTAHLEDALAQRNTVIIYEAQPAFIPAKHDSGKGKTSGSTKKPAVTQAQNCADTVEALAEQLNWALAPFEYDAPKDSLFVMARTDSASQKADTLAIIPYLMTVRVSDVWDKLVETGIVFDNPIYLRQKNTVNSVSIPTTESGLFGSTALAWAGWLIAVGEFVLIVFLRL